MHPLLASPRRLAIYLVAWLPLAAPLAALLYEGGARNWPAIVGVAAASVWTCALICIGSYYTARSAPIATTSIARITRVLFGATLVSTGLWLVITAGLIVLFQSAIGPADAGHRVFAVFPLLGALACVAFLLGASGHYLWIAYTEKLQAERRALELQVVAREAELKTLRAQIDPHFLFNSLHSISSLTTSDPAAARRMCVGLGDFLRSTIRLGERSFITLAEELALIDGYVGVEQVRLGSRLIVVRTIDPEVKNCIVPPLLLHPLVENAITHGIGHMLDCGHLSITVDRIDRMRMSIKTGSLLEPELVVVAGAAPVAARLHEGDPQNWSQYVRIIVANDCDPDRPAGRGTGMGLANVRRRLDTTYRHEASLTVRNEPDSTKFEAEIILPFWTGTENLKNTSRPDFSVSAIAGDVR